MCCFLVEREPPRIATHTAVRRSKHATLVSNTVDTVTFSSKPKTIEVRNLDSTTVVFFRTAALLRPSTVTIRTDWVLARGSK